MSYYDYTCDTCETSFEHEKNIETPHPRYCPLCGADGLRRVFKPLAFSIPGDRNRKVAEPKAPDGVEIKPRSS